MQIIKGLICRIKRKIHVYAWSSWNIFYHCLLIFYVMSPSPTGVCAPLALRHPCCKRLLLSVLFASYIHSLHFQHIFLNAHLIVFVFSWPSAAPCCLRGKAESSSMEWEIKVAMAGHLNPLTACAVVLLNFWGFCNLLKYVTRLCPCTFRSICWGEPPHCSLSG